MESDMQKGAASVFAKFCVYFTLSIGTVLLPAAQWCVNHQCSICCLEPGKFEVLKMLDLQTKSAID
jgi:hypothetical protein